MKTTVFLSIAVLAGGLPLATGSNRNQQSDIRVVPSSALPAAAQQASQDLLLHPGSFGTHYLYLEQNEGQRLVILDVTEPANIRLAATVDTGIAKAYDFVEMMGESFELIRFRDGSGSALLDLQKPTAPRVESVEWGAIEPVQKLGDSGYLAVRLRTAAQPLPRAERDIQVVSAGVVPHLVTAVDGVTRVTEMRETGTIFLLGRNGLTVIRRLDKEQQSAMEELIKRYN